MKKKIIFKTLLILTIFTFALTSCKKEKESDTGTIIVKTTVPGYGKISGVNVLLEDENDANIGEKITNSEGKVIFKDLLEGTYHITCSYIPNNREEHLGWADIQLPKGQTKTITIDLD